MVPLKVKSTIVNCLKTLKIHHAVSFFWVASFIKTGYDFMLEEYILFRAQQCIDGFVNYLKRRVSQKNSSMYNDLHPHAMAPAPFWIACYSGKIIETNFFFRLNLNWISYYMKSLSYTGSNLPSCLSSNYEAEFFLMHIVPWFY